MKYNIGDMIAAFDPINIGYSIGLITEVECISDSEMVFISWGDSLSSTLYTSESVDHWIQINHAKHYRIIE